jgi:hypothetical protein
MRGYACVLATGPIEIDGRPDDPAWVVAPWTAAFVDIEGDRRPVPTLRTRVKMVWNNDYFYFAAELEEPHLWATLGKGDSVIYYDNDFEVFIDPDGDTHLYSEIELNAFNTVWDLLLIKPYRDGGPAINAWDISGLQTAVHQNGTVNDPSDEDRGWSVEIAVPWEVLRETTVAACPPNPGDRWRVNFSRVQWQLEEVDGEYRKVIDPATGKPFPENNWVWSPQREIAMHEPEHWGIVEFRGEPADAPVKPTTEDAAAWHLRYVTYLLAAMHERDGSYPTHFVALEPPAGAPALDPAWSWPPVHEGDGRRYTLTLRRGDGSGALIVNENGRLIHTR